MGRDSDTFSRSTSHEETTYSLVKKSSDNYVFNDCLTVYCCATSKYFDTEKYFNFYINEPHFAHFVYAEGQLWCGLMLREKEEPETLEKSTVTYIWRLVEPDAEKSDNYNY